MDRENCIPLVNKNKSHEKKVVSRKDKRPEEN
jgi:hypothetical protein